MAPDAYSHAGVGLPTGARRSLHWTRGGSTSLGPGSQRRARAATFMPVGLLAGDQMPWRRWWLPVGAQPALIDGLLPEPYRPYSRYLDPDYSQLAQSAHVKARVLLADGGMGKSTELRRELGRLRSAGEYAALIDLGALASTVDIRSSLYEAERAWRDAGSDGDLVLVLDAFDEPLIDVVNLNDVLSETLDRFDKDRLRVTVASRGSLWRESLHNQFVKWWGPEQVVDLELAPLTASDVIVAAASEDLDAEGFVNAIRTAGAGPLLARPITLRLMLAATREGRHPTNRREAYALGVRGLADESSERRRERGRTGASLEERLAAARRLATASLLSGRSSIVRRARAASRSASLALDEVAVNAGQLAALDDVFDSALLSGTSDARVWCHHSVAEYLCAQALAALPVSAAWSLLAAPGDPSTLRPQLEETAAWTALLQDDMFEQLLHRHLRVLVKGDVGARSPEDRKRVARAVVTSLGGESPLLERGARVPLDYPGVEDDLRPFLDTNQPQWRRREAIHWIASAHSRGFDRELVSIVKHVAGGSGDNDALALATYAAHALSGVLDQATIGDMRALAADRGVPSQVRAALVTSLFPTHLAAEDVAQLLPPDVRWEPGLGRTVIRAMQEAADANLVPVADALAWFSDAPEAAHPDERARRLASAAALAVIREGPATERWEAAVSVIKWLFGRSPSGLPVWSSSDLDDLGPERRRGLSRELLPGRAAGSIVVDLIRQGIVRAEDLHWWLDRLEEDAAGAGDGGLSAAAVVRALVGLVLAADDDDDVLATARERCASSSVLASHVGAELALDSIERFRQERVEEELERRAREADQARFRFSQQRLDEALSARDLSAALEELDLSPAPADRPPGPSGPTTAWTTADPSARQRTSRLAAEHLVADQFDLDQYDDVQRLGLAISVAAAGDEDLDEVPARNWSRWLPMMLQVSTWRGAETCLQRALAYDADGVVGVLDAILVEDTSGGLGVPQWAIDALPSDLLGRLAARAADLAAEPHVSPSALSVLLAVANAGSPAESGRVALRHVDARGSAPAADQPRRRAHPETEAWLRAVAAARALIANPGPHDALEGLLTAFRHDRAFAVETIRSLDPWQAHGAFRALSSDQLADLYLWAREAMPSESRATGVTRSDRAQELPEDLLALLAERGDGPAVAAMRRLSEATGNVYLRDSAERLAAKVAAGEAAPPSPRVVLEVLDDPARRAITSRAQLARVVLETLDALAADFAHDRGLRRRLWERQREGTRWKHVWVPSEETRVSQELKAELALRLRGRVAVVREVEIQPALGPDGADQPDLLTVALTTDSAALDLPLEVKGNYHADVVSALTTQLAERYLTGPVGNEGIYVVAYFSQEMWDPADKHRRSHAAQRSLEDLRKALAEAARAASVRGKTVHVRVIEVPLGHEGAT